jgi:hexosaminidase
MNIIPRPSSITSKDGYFQFVPASRILLNPYNAETRQTAELFATQFRAVSGFALPIIPATAAGVCDLLLSLQPEKYAREGYHLNANARYIEISAATTAGLFYGLQTLQQLLPAEFYAGKPVEMPWRIPVCKIDDAPAFRWRGMHLDVSRHFFGVSFIKRYIDLLAMHKLNVFHWHLTDDNGWRIEIKRYPELTNTAAWRSNYEHLPWMERDEAQDAGHGVYGGYYTQEQVKEIVAYAAARQIMVIPEIEMPGHSREVFAAYPQYSCRGETLTVAPGGYWPNVDIFCAGKDESFDFLQGILEEVIQLFPAPYVHIGGDEADKTRWKQCPLCQARIRQENLADEKELQSWFIARIQNFLASRGKKLIGWDEISEGGLCADATVMCWRGDGVDAASMATGKGHDVVMCPNPTLYFDWRQSEHPLEPGAFGVTSLQTVYAYHPVPDGFDAEAARHVLGAQGNVWTEWMPTQERVEYMALPRMSALAEVVWSPREQRDFADFSQRLDALMQRFKAMGVNCRKPV